MHYCIHGKYWASYGTYAESHKCEGVDTIPTSLMKKS